MVSINECIGVCVIALLYLVILPIQLAMFPMQYYSVKDVIYSGNRKKAVGALATRFLFILFLCVISWIIDKNNRIVIWGITIGSFLCAWPSIYHYQLFAFIRNRSKIPYFIACVASIFFSWACATFIMTILLPMVFDNKGFYLIDNNGIKTIWTVINLVSPVALRKFIKEEEQDNPYLLSDTFPADLYLTKRKMQLSNDYIDQYSYEIESSAEKYGMNYGLLRTIIQLEYINRGSIINRLIEKAAVHFVPGLLVKKDASLGLTQIKISNAKGYFHMTPCRYVEQMLKPEISIDLCAYILKNMLDEYEYYEPCEYDECLTEIYDDKENISQNYMVGLYIASEYICGYKNTLKKYVLVYAAIIQDEFPALYVDNGNG